METDDWKNLIPVLSHPSVYEAFGISSLPSSFPVGTSVDLEVIGTLANLLYRGARCSKYVDNYEIALKEARSFLDDFYAPCYNGIAYVIQGAWCDWFVDEDLLDEYERIPNQTLLFNNGNVWWLFAVTVDV